MTPERRAALERLKDSRYLSGQTHELPRQMVDDLCIARDTALSDYPANDTCEMTRQELIAEVARLKKRDTGAVC